MILFVPKGYDISILIEVYMKKSLVLFCLMLCFVASCGKKAPIEDSNVPAEPKVQDTDVSVVVDEVNAVDAYGDYIGTWGTDDGEWAVTFDPNGSLVSFKSILSKQLFVVEEGGLSDYYDDGHLASVFVLGKVDAQYSSDSRNMRLVINIDHFELGIPNEVVEEELQYFSVTGDMVNILEGSFSSDFTVWEVIWTNKSNTEGFGEDIGESELTFKRID